MRMYDLTPNFDSRKSFYGKAKVCSRNNELMLYSYNTHVASIVDGEAYIKKGQSMTSNRHIREFLRQEGFEVESVQNLELFPELEECL